MISANTQEHCIWSQVVLKGGDTKITPSPLTNRNGTFLFDVWQQQQKTKQVPSTGRLTNLVLLEANTSNFKFHSIYHCLANQTHYVTSTMTCDESQLKLITKTKAMHTVKRFNLMNQNILLTATLRLSNPKA